MNKNFKTNQTFVKIRLSKDKSPEEILWRAVICQAIEDILITSNNQRKQCFKKRATNWFKKENDELNSVCEMAGVQKNRLINYLDELISK